MAAEADSSAGLTAVDISRIFKDLDATLNQVIFQGQLFGMNFHNLLNFQSNLETCVGIYTRIVAFTLWNICEDSRKHVPVCTLPFLGIHIVSVYGFDH